MFIFELLYFFGWDDDFKILSCWLYDVANDSLVFANLFNLYEELAKLHVELYDANCLS